MAAELSSLPCFEAFRVIFCPDFYSYFCLVCAGVTSVFPNGLSRLIFSFHKARHRVRGRCLECTHARLKAKASLERERERCSHRASGSITPKKLYTCNVRRGKEMENPALSPSRGAKLRGFAKGWFPKGWFRRMFPRNKNRNEGTFAKTTLLETALLSPNDPFWC